MCLSALAMTRGFLSRVLHRDDALVCQKERVGPKFSYLNERTLAFAKSAGYVHPVIWTLASGCSSAIVCQEALGQI